MNQPIWKWALLLLVAAPVGAALRLWRWIRGAR